MLEFLNSSNGSICFIIIVISVAFAWFSIHECVKLNATIWRLRLFCEYLEVVYFKKRNCNYKPLNWNKCYYRSFNFKKIIDEKTIVDTFFKDLKEFKLYELDEEHRKQVYSLENSLKSRANNISIKL